MMMVIIMKMIMKICDSIEILFHLNVAIFGALTYVFVYCCVILLAT